MNDWNGNGNKFSFQNIMDGIDGKSLTYAVILVEERYKSKVKDLNRMAAMLKIENAKVIGAVLI